MALYAIVNEVTGLVEQMVEGKDTKNRAAKIRDGLNENAARNDVRHEGQPVTYRSAKAEDEFDEVALAEVKVNLERGGVAPGTEA